MERVHTRRSKKSQYAVTAPLPSKPGSSSSGSEGSGSTQAAAPALPPWEKVLWRRQPYPDNYTDASFLQHLVWHAPFHITVLLWGRGGRGSSSTKLLPSLARLAEQLHCYPPPPPHARSSTLMCQHVITGVWC